MAAHNELGLAGEKIAVELLQKKGFRIREQNWRFQKSEVDIIAQKGSLLLIIEVKTRSTHYFGDPQDFIKEQKIKLIMKAANHYVISNELDVEVRFDVIGIVKNHTGTSITHLEDAFYYF